MDFITEFFNGFFNFIDKLPNGLGILTLIIVLIIFIIAPQIKSSFSWLIKKIGLKKRSCGDCILLIFGVSEKYKNEIQKTERKILETQMNYVEQKIEIMTLDLLRTYRDDQNIFKNETSASDDENLERDYINYKESLMNAIELSKKEIRRSFKENGFDKKSGKEFADYVKEKTKDLLSIARKYMLSSYFKNAIVPLEYRFDRFDERGFEDIIFEVYIKAKEIRVEAETNIDYLENKLKFEIDQFIKEKK